MRLALKLFRGEPAISGFDWNFSAIHTSSPPFSTDGCGFGPPLPLTAASTWTWIGHPVSGLLPLTKRPIKTWFPFGSKPLVLNLASKRNSPDRSTKSTRLHLSYSASTACKHRVSGSLSLPSRGSFHRSFTVLCAIVVLLWIPPCQLGFRVRDFHPLWSAFPKLFCYPHWINYAVRTPKCTHSGLASFAFARRYLRNRFFFLFLTLLRCFSSGSSPPYVMDWRMDAYGFRMRVSPFRYLWIISYLHLPTAFRSLSRLSSALSAKASTLRS